MSLLGRLFGSSKAGNEIIKGGVNALDKIWYTEEEKADEKSKAKTELMTVYMAWLDSTSGSRLARRGIAFSITGVWALEHLSGVAFRSVSVFANDTGAFTAEKALEAGNMLTDSAIENNSLVGVVLLFYFGGPAAIDGVKGLVSKWTNKETGVKSK